MASTVWRGRLSFGMVAIPVRLHRAARRERIRFHRVYRPGAAEPEAPPEEEPAAPEPAPAPPVLREFPRPPESQPGPEPQPEVARVSSAPVSGRSHAPLEESEILKGYELEKDQYVVLDPKEVAALRPRTSTELEITEFVRAGEIDPIYYDASYYVVPDSGGEKPYAVLYRALAESGYAALGSFAMHGREYAAVIRPGSRGLILHTLFYANEIHGEDEYRAQPGAASGQEVALAAQLVRALAAGFDAGKLKDTLEQRLHDLIESRREAALSAAPAGQERKRAPVVDIMDALRRSLEMARKPAKAEPATEAPRRRTTKRRA